MSTSDLYMIYMSLITCRHFNAIPFCNLILFTDVKASLTWMCPQILLQCLTAPHPNLSRDGQSNRLWCWTGLPMSEYVEAHCLHPTLEETIIHQSLDFNCSYHAYINLLLMGFQLFLCIFQTDTVFLSGGGMWHSARVQEFNVQCTCSLVK